MNEFDKKLIKQAVGISWWKRILLWFVKPTYGYDFGSHMDKSVIVIVKKLFGKIYIIEEIISD